MLVFSPVSKSVTRTSASGSMFTRFGPRDRRVSLYASFVFLNHGESPHLSCFTPRRPPT
jgi:hypothetical protein